MLTSIRAATCAWVSPGACAVRPGATRALRRASAQRRRRTLREPPAVSTARSRCPVSRQRRGSVMSRLPLACVELVLIQAFRFGDRRAVPPVPLTGLVTGNEQNRRSVRVEDKQDPDLRAAPYGGLSSFMFGRREAVTVSTSGRPLSWSVPLQDEDGLVDQGGRLARPGSGTASVGTRPSSGVVRRSPRRHQEGLTLVAAPRLRGPSRSFRRSCPSVGRFSWWEAVSRAADAYDLTAKGIRETRALRSES
jgi:hypothetical protein